MQEDFPKKSKNEISRFLSTFLFVIISPFAFIFSIPMRISKFIKKSKNKDQYKNAAHYTLSTDKYSPTISSLFLCFRASDLNIFDSYFNALYLYVSKKDHNAESELKKCYENIAVHPYGYGMVCFKDTFWSLTLKFLSSLPYIFSFPSRVISSFRKKSRRNENSFKKAILLANFFKRRLSYILPCIAAAIVFLYIHNVSHYQVVLSASYDGNDIGYIESKKIMDDTLKNVESTLSESTGVSMKLSSNLSYSLEKISNPSYADTTELYSSVMSCAKKNFTSAYGLYIDGTLVASVEDKEVIDNVLHKVTEGVGEGNEVKIANDIKVLKQDYPTSSVKNEDQLKEILVGSPEDTAIMASSVVAAYKADESAPTPKIIRNIPSPINDNEINFSNAYYIDDTEKTVEITYKTEKLEAKTIVDEFQTVYEYKSDLYKNVRYVKQKGQNGKKATVEKITYINGKESSRALESETIIEPTVNKIVVSGLKSLPENESGSSEPFMIYPYDGEIYNGFGWRNRDSYQEFHSGIDLPAPKGTPVLAAASGVAEYVGDPHNGYGNLIIIHHSDGKQTYYAHLNDIYISKGDVISQGSIIGEVGSTGDSTGNHVHFEVRVNGQPQDPLKYLVDRGE